MGKPKDIQPGDIVFFKRFKKEPHPNFPEIQFAGQGFGMLLGHLPLRAKPPGNKSIFQGLGACGLLTFDDVAEFLGAEAGKTCVEKFEAKYNPTPEELEAAKAELKPPLGLVGPSGKPIELEKGIPEFSPEQVVKDITNESEPNPTNH